MKKLRKIIAFVSIAAFVLAGFAGTVSASSSQAQGTATADEGETEGAVESGDSCAVPTKIYLNDGLSADIDYFNTDDQISGNWDFDDHGCAIEKYIYRFIKKKSPGSPWESVTDWTTINDASKKQITANHSNGLVTPLVEGETYRLLVRAYNAAGWSVGDVKLADKSDGQTLDTIAPTAITDLNIASRAINDPSVVLGWSLSSDATSGVDRYEIYRAASPFTKIGQTTGATFVDNVYADNVNVQYKLLIWDNAGNSIESNIVSALVDDIAPAAPVINYTRSGAKITINWAAVANASTYLVYRDGAAIPVGGSLSYVDNAAKRGETHSYYVVAVDEAGNLSPASNALVIYIPRPQVSSISTSQVLGAATGAGEVKAQEEPSQEKIDEGQVGAEETSAPEETAEEAKTNWSLIIAIIIAAAIVISGVLYWWYAREDEEEDKI